MPTQETHPKPDRKPPATEPQNTPEEEKNVDSDGGERQPNQHTDEKK